MSSNEGVRDIDNDGRSGQFPLDAFANEAIDPGRRRSRHELVPARLELDCKLATDQAGPAYDHDIHFGGLERVSVLRRGQYLARN